MTKACTTLMWLLVVAVFLYAVGTLPSAAHGAPAPKATHEQPKVNHVNPDGTGVLYIYPGDPQFDPDTEQIIMDPRAVSSPEEDHLTGDPFIDAKDPRTWA